MAGEGKPVSASRLVLAQVTTPRDANVYGNVHGGNIMRLADTAAAVAAIGHSERNCVTASVDRFDFHAPVCVGNRGESAMGPARAFRGILDSGRENGVGKHADEH